MIKDKFEEDKKREEEENAFGKGQSPGSLKKNPNPRANENLPEKDQKKDNPEDSTGPGSEITDGEDG